MPFIAFLGCDGSGKSAVIHGLTSRLEAAGHKVTLGHWRPKPFAPAAPLLHTADAPHGQQPRGLAGSILKLGWLWFNWWFAWFQNLKRENQEGFVLFDRYHGDLIVDPKRYRYGGPMWLANLASRVMPQPHLVIFLEASTDILLSRKKEVSESTLADLGVRYGKFCEADWRRYTVNAEIPIDQVISEISEIIASKFGTGNLAW